MKRTNRTARVLLGLAAAATALTGLAAPTASAATPQVTAGCYGSSCADKDPVDMACSTDAYTVDSASSALGTVELRYSPSCKANWARIYDASYGQVFWVESQNDFVQWHAQGATGYSDMIDGSGPARACIPSYTCTVWH
ncbi:DUF2690 domain-containing protein [Kitasatospora sp. NPDC058218]|uniref:DUF2690 domain-containing protein n=1 Tax=Kitasatospora sp. NPDC058218 TaxID=3346385 RepID=UPI0036DF118E